MSGRPSLYGGTLQFVHPEVDRISPRKDEEDRPDEEQVDWEARLHTGGLVPLYPSTQELSRVGLDSAGFRRVIRRALSEHLQALRDPLPANLLRVRELAPLDAALQAVHFPRSGEELQRSLRRLKYEEFFRFQLKLALKRRWLKTGAKGIAYSVTSTLARGLVER